MHQSEDEISPTDDSKNNEQLLSLIKSSGEVMA